MGDGWGFWSGTAGLSAGDGWVSGWHRLGFLVGYGWASSWHRLGFQRGDGWASSPRRFQRGGRLDLGPLARAVVGRAGTGWIPALADKRMARAPQVKPTQFCCATYVPAWGFFGVVDAWQFIL
ncbi:hypothetical protein GCM10022247_02000 [Allokutzneria multivorans]|uniref:Uncharacterized protein n=1 Tax=Allokutzneria multivorans TaxID=1142134 RepID=A0ABP7QSG0_9PSEU